MRFLPLIVALGATDAFLHGPANVFRQNSFAGTLVRQNTKPASSASSLSMMAGKVLVSGFLDSKERTDQFVFDVLHKQGDWEKIVAFSHEIGFAKKRLVSRTARYSGLLNVLEFEEGDRYDPAVMKEKLSGCEAWLCFNCDPEKIKEQVQVAKDAGVKSLVLTSSISAADAKEAGLQDVFENSGIRFTFIRTGQIKEGKEGGAFMTAEVAEDLPMEEITREDAVRAAAESFKIEEASKKAFALGKGDEMSAEYLKVLRETGADRRTELAKFISGGFAEYVKNKTEEALAKMPKVETEEEKAARLAEHAKRQEEFMKKAQEEMRIRRIQLFKEKVDNEARKILQREFRDSIWKRDQNAQTEEEYINDPANWDRAVERGLKIVQSLENSGGVMKRDKSDGEPSDWEIDDGDEDTHWRPEVFEEDEDDEVVVPDTAPAPVGATAGGASSDKDNEKKDDK